MNASIEEPRKVSCSLGQFADDIEAGTINTRARLQELHFVLNIRKLYP